MKLKEMVEAHRAEMKRLQEEADLAAANDLEVATKAKAVETLAIFNAKFAEEIPIIEEAGIVTTVLVQGDSIFDLQGVIQFSKDVFFCQEIKVFRDYYCINSSNTMRDYGNKIDFLSFLYDNFLN